MTYKRYPHTGTLLYVSGANTYSATGYRTQGTVATIDMYCNIQVNTGGYRVGRDGDSVNYRYQVFCPLLETVFADTKGLSFGFNGASYQVIDITNFTKHTEIII